VQRPILADPLPRIAVAVRTAPIRKWLRRMVMATAVMSAPAIFGVQAASADTQVFRDILRPNGVERSQAQKFADGRSCGLSANNTFTNARAFQKCMRARGWVLDHIVPDAPPTWIDPDTGLECHSAGIAAVCDPPQGTTTYVNRHGYPCRRTGLVAICTNL
jgi:hypothetical protein